MGIQKIGCWSLRSSKTFSLSNGQDREIEDNPVLGADFSDDSDDCELTELHCEPGMLEGQLCGIPYELYDLPDLSEILSLDTWNSCLTEEERLYLSAYLPDMDQQTFCLTMKELFEGSDLYFGNPLDVFFKRLKGGYYPPKVAHLREGLQLIKRKKYYHALKSFHDKMTQIFIDMNRMWDQCERSSSVEERISLWKKKRKRNLIDLLDLNKFPKDDHLLSEEDSLGMKSIESVATRDVLPFLSVNGMKHVAPNCIAKGVLKMKASENGLLPKQSLKVIGSDTSEQHRSVPKGVLKIVPKFPYIQLEQSEVMPRAARPAFLVSQGLQDIKFPSLPAYMHFPDPSGLYGSPFLREKVGGSRVNSSLNQPQCLLNQQESTLRSSYLSENSNRKIKRQVIPALDENSILGKCEFASNIRRDPHDEYNAPMNPMGARKYTFSGENLWPNLQEGTQDFCLRSLESSPFGIHYHGREQHVELMKDKHVTVYSRIPEVIPRTSAVDNSKQEMQMSSSSDLMRGENDISTEKSEKLLIKSSVCERFKDEPVLPLTYKRRKDLAKINSLDTGKTITRGSDLSSNQQLMEGAIAVNIRFTARKDLSLNMEDILN